MDAYRRGVAALLGHLGLPATACAGHKEFALPHGRKIDPSFDMSTFRAGVAAILAGTAPPPVLIPATEPPAPGKTPRATLRRGATGNLVSVLQQLLSVKVDGKFGAITEARVRALQRELMLVPDGIVGPKTWQKLDARPAVEPALVPAPVTPLRRDAEIRLRNLNLDRLRHVPHLETDSPEAPATDTKWSAVLDDRAPNGAATKTQGHPGADPQGLLS